MRKRFTTGQGEGFYLTCGWAAAPFDSIQVTLCNGQNPKSNVKTLTIESQNHVASEIIQSNHGMEAHRAINESRQTEIVQKIAVFGGIEKMTELWTIKEVANFLKLHEKHIYRMVEQRRIPFHRLGKRRGLRFDPEKIKLWIEERAVSPQEHEI